MCPDAQRLLMCQQARSPCLWLNQNRSRHASARLARGDAQSPTTITYNMSEQCSIPVFWVNFMQETANPSDH